MPLTFDDLHAIVGYSLVSLRPSPENERIFPDSAFASPCYELEHTPLTRRIHFWFTHAAVDTNLLLDPSVHSCLTCSLRRLLAYFQMEENDRNTMIEFARMKVAAAFDSGIYPAHGVVLLEVRQRGESMEEYDVDDDEEEECEVLFSADRRAVEAMARKKVTFADYLETCTICLEEFGEGQEALVIPCSHVFHGDCIKTWLKKSNSCPLCRFKLSVAADGYWSRVILVEEDRCRIRTSL